MTKRKRPNPEPAREAAFTETTIAAWLLGLSALLFVALRWPCAAMPLERDEGAYAYVAQRTLLGEVPYRDVFDHKPPGVYLAYLPPVGLFGASVAAIHVNLYLWTALTALFLFLIARRLAGPLAAACSVLVFSAITIEPTWLATAANTEQFMLLPMVASVWLLLRAEESSGGWLWLAAGALAAAACWLKPVAVTNALFLAALAFVWWRKRSPRAPISTLVRSGLLALGGAVLISAAFVGFFVARGAGRDLVDAVFAHNVEYVGEVAFSAGLSDLGSTLRAQSRSLWPIWLAAAAAVLDWRSGKRPVALLLGGALAAAAAGIVVGWHFRQHYFLQAAPALAGAAGVTIAAGIRAGMRSAKRAITRLAGFLLPVLVLIPWFVVHFAFFFRLSPIEKTVALYWPNVFDVASDLAAHVQQRTGPSETVFVFGSEPEILFLAKRRSATRYVVFYPLTTPGPTAELRQREAVEQIRSANPRAVLMTELSFSTLETSISPRVLRQEVARMLSTGWELDGVEVFEGRRGRLVFGQPARDLVERARASGEPPPIDMFLFIRR